ncbi:MAG: LLM class flavin-dependent oxidoreductase [Sphaerobacteraceae bacterium]|nr:MAG: LLM class flavin-dependent oxidoreductase [Sphaerobacteraceae bacterium]
MAKIAEDAGFDQFWVSHDLFFRSSPVILAAVAQATSRIEIGTCIVNPYTVHPSEIAMMAATLDELSGGRFNLGIGAGAGEFLKWLGMPQERPLATTRHAIEAINATLTGQPVEGWESEAYLRFDAPRRVPIYLAAFSPNMLRLIGEVADGALPLLFPPEHYDTVYPLVQEGAKTAGRSMEEIDFAACIWCSISDDRQAAEDVLKDKIAYYGHALSPLIWDRLGVTQDDFRPIEHALMTERDPIKARSLVDERMLRIGIAGSPDVVIERLESLVDRGAKHLSFGPPLGPDPAEAIRTLGREILPHFA